MKTATNTLSMRFSASKDEASPITAKIEMAKCHFAPQRTVKRRTTWLDASRQTIVDLNMYSTKISGKITMGLATDASVNLQKRVMGI